MLRSRWLRAVPFAVPGLLLAGFGMVHPAPLTLANAQWWANLHIILLPVFPLLGAAQWVFLASAPAVLRWPGRLAAFGYAAFYSGLDAVAGIAAGTVVHAQQDFPPAVGALFATADPLGYLGAGCFLAANLFVTAAIVRNAGWQAVPGSLLLLAAAVSFLDSHIFWPRGVFTMIGIGVGMYLLGLTRRQASPAFG